MPKYNHIKNLDHVITAENNKIKNVQTEQEYNRLIKIEKEKFEKVIADLETRKKRAMKDESLSDRAMICNEAFVDLMMKLGVKPKKRAKLAEDIKMLYFFERNIKYFYFNKYTYKFESNVFGNKSNFIKINAKTFEIEDRSYKIKRILNDG